MAVIFNMEQIYAKRDPAWETEMGPPGLVRLPTRKITRDTDWAIKS